MWTLLCDQSMLSTRNYHSSRCESLTLLIVIIVLIIVIIIVVVILIINVVVIVFIDIVIIIVIITVIFTIIIVITIISIIDIIVIVIIVIITMLPFTLRQVVFPETFRYESVSVEDFLRKNRMANGDHGFYGYKTARFSDGS